MKELAAPARCGSLERVGEKVAATGLLNIFAKNERTDLTQKERGVLKTILANTVKAHRHKRKLH